MVMLVLSGLRKTLQTFSEGMWEKNGLIVVPDVADLRERCLCLHHDTLFAGHLGRDRTMHLVQQTN